MRTMTKETKKEGPRLKGKGRADAKASRQLLLLCIPAIIGYILFNYMLTDSRSFSSFPRHEYYRRILCNRLGELVESGQYPADERTLGQIVENICGKNAAAFLYL